MRRRRQYKLVIILILFSIFFGLTINFILLRLSYFGSTGVQQLAPFPSRDKLNAPLAHNEQSAEVIGQEVEALKQQLFSANDEIVALKEEINAVKLAHRDCLHSLSNLLLHYPQHTPTLIPTLRLPTEDEPINNE
jgi:hypothetical protein